MKFKNIVVAVPDARVFGIERDILRMNRFSLFSLSLSHSLSNPHLKRYTKKGSPGLLFQGEILD